MASFYCCILPLFLFLFISTSFGHVQALPINHDLHFLLSFKSYNQNATALETWVGPNPCSGSWTGVKCYRGRVVGIFLENASLAGAVDPLLLLGQIRVLALRRNSLSGTLPSLNNTTNPSLRHLLLSHNNLSGRLDVALPSLLTLRVEHNSFHGGLQDLHLPMLRSLNVSRNKLAGEISSPLARFPSSCFRGNLALCGSPLPSCFHAYTIEASSTNASMNSTTTNTSSSVSNFTKFGLTAILGIGIGNALLVTVSLAITMAMFGYLRRRLRAARCDPSAGLSFMEQDHKCEEKDEKGGGGLVCFEGGEELRLESLLKASAEVLGKGVSGSTYKAVLDDGVVVAVKRLSALQFPSRSKGFDRHMRLIGRLRHAHVVSLRAYCNSNGERLLVYDYLPSGSLHSLLQGNGGTVTGNGTIRNLGWTTRKNILFGAAQGLNYIHTFPARPPLVHANIKPSNILVDEHGNARISECGLMRFATNVHQSLPPHTRHPSELFLDRASGGAPSSSRWHGYCAPELSSGAARAMQESDVYSFGMVLLEVVTDNAVDDGECEGEMMGLVKVGMLCSAEAPEERPKMGQVLGMMSEFM